MFFAFLVNACFFEPEQGIEPVKTPVTAEKKNPYSVENVTKAFQNVAARSGGRIQVVPPSTTHNYVRFEPQNLSQIMRLQELGYELWDEPLDQHIEYSGDTYHQPGLPDSLNYYYTLVPDNYTITQEVPSSILGQVVLFDEDAGDEQDPEDPWIPDPENCPDPNNPNCPCYEGPCARRAGDSTLVDLREDLVKKTTKYLLDAGVNLVELHNEMMALAGYEDEVIPTDGAGRTQGERYYPAGCIMVRDNTINQDVPVKFAFVKSRRFFKLATTYTNVNGCFTISKGYRNKAQIIVKFKNAWAKVRGVNHALNPFEWTHAVKAKLGLFEKNAMQNIHHVFPYSSNAESRTAMKFTAAHVINTVHDINQYCAANGINTIPNNMGIWVTTSSWFRASTAPMLNKVGNQTLAGNFLAAIPVAGQLFKIMTTFNYMPDVAITINNTQSGTPRYASDISATTFHELGHAVHYNKVGGNYWVDVILRFIANANVNNGYGTKTSTGSGLVAVIESWAYFAGATFNAAKYQTSDPFTRDYYLRFLENQKRDDTRPKYYDGGTYSYGWIPWGMVHDLTDVGEPGGTGINDGVSGYTINGIFKGYHANSTTVQGLKNAILSHNNNHQSTQVNNLVTSYGW